MCSSDLVAQHPDHAYFLDTQGWVLYKLGRHAEAATLIERALGHAPNFALLYDHLGDVYTRLGRPADARTAWQRALDLDPENEAVRRKLGGR